LGQKLPNSNLAWIPAEKLAHYLLSTTHAIGKTKARFFRLCGYSESNLDVFARDLLDIAASGSVVDIVESDFGRKYIVRGKVKSPAARVVELQTVWIVEMADLRPRFVTAYPSGRST
jgi:hypothetical protein